MKLSIKPALCCLFAQFVGFRAVNRQTTTVRQSQRSLLLATTLIAACSVSSAGAQPVKDPAREAAIRRAIVYLSAEVRDWSRNNGCFSCHNNGVAAVALFSAKRQRFEVPDEALAETIEWLKDPHEWENNRDDPAVSDKKLARFHFALARAEAVNADAIDRGPVQAELAEMLVADQAESGAWVVDPQQVLGSPLTLGDVFATALAAVTLMRISGTPHQVQIAKGLDWVAIAPARSTVDRGSKLMLMPAIPGIRRFVGDAAGMPPAAEVDADQIPGLAKALTDTQNSDGGWGPYPNTPSEIFDTCVAVLGLGLAREVPTICEDDACSEALTKAMKYLLDAQLPAGGWRATTRPSGGDSYAQHIATTAWVLFTLLGPQ